MILKPINYERSRTINTSIYISPNSPLVQLVLTTIVVILISLQVLTYLKIVLTNPVQKMAVLQPMFHQSLL